jgi:hypothetical protein
MRTVTAGFVDERHPPPIPASPASAATAGVETGVARSSHGFGGAEAGLRATMEAAGIEPAQHSSRQSSRGRQRSERLPNVPPLDISADQFEAFAHRVVAITAEYLATLDNRPTVQPTSAASTSSAFDLPVSGTGALAALAEPAKLEGLWMAARVHREPPHDRRRRQDNRSRSRDSSDGNRLVAGCQLCDNS